MKKGCQVATSERQVGFHVVVENDTFLTGLHLPLLAAIYTIKCSTSKTTNEIQQKLQMKYHKS